MCAIVIGGASCVHCTMQCVVAEVLPYMGFGRAGYVLVDFISVRYIVNLVIRALLM